MLEHEKITSSKVPILKKFLTEVESGKEGMFYTERPKSTSGTFDFPQNVQRKLIAVIHCETRSEIWMTLPAILRLSYAAGCKSHFEKANVKTGSFFFTNILEMPFTLLHLTDSINYDDTCVKLIVH